MKKISKSRKLNVKGSEPKKMGYSKDMEVYGPKNVVDQPKVRKPNHGIEKR